MTTRFQRFAESLQSFEKSSALNSFGRVRSLADHLAQGQEERDRTMARLVRVDAEERARKAAAEHAAIETPERLDALIDATKAQDRQLTDLVELLQVLTVQATDSAKTDDERWAKS